MTCQDLTPAPGRTLDAAHPAISAASRAFLYCPLIVDGVVPTWARADSLCLAPDDDQSVTLARRHTAAVLIEWGMAHVRHDAGIIVGELCSNALNATRRAGIPGPIGLRLLANPLLLAMEVWDCAADVPRLRPPGPPVLDGADTAEPRGNGLLIVAELSCDWGHLARPDGGKVVYSLIKIPHVAGRS